MELKNITSENEKLTRSGEWTLVFWAPWGKPSIECVRSESSKRHAGKVGLVNVEENREIAERFSVFIYPTTVVLRDGKEQSREIGFEV